VRAVSRIAVRVALVVAAVVVTLGALEVLLRVRPTLLGQTFANGAFSRYTVRAGGIYYYDPNLRMNFMIPNQRTTMYYNGYSWDHETDALGFRNAPLHIPADVVLLGDSLVYGHGVAFEDTLGHRLEERSGLRVANLARQGDCAFQQAYLLTEYIEVFAPRFVISVFTWNDIEDLHSYLSDAEMEAFIAQPLDAIRYPARVPTDVAVRDREERLRGRAFWKRLDEQSYVVKMGRFIRYLRQEGRLGGGGAGGPAEPGPTHLDPTSVGWRYVDHAVAYMAYLSRRHGARLLLVPMSTAPQFEILRDIARRHDVAFLDTRAFLGGGWWLPHDGHFSPEGARQLAATIARALGR
jgi:hypothetical protein